MASISIHLAVAKRYIEKQGKIENINEFYNAVIEVDLAKDKSKSHYGGIENKNSVEEDLKNKVLLYKFLKNNNIDTEYQKGVFLHLVTDYLFYNNFLDKKYLKEVSDYDFGKDLYYSYSITNEYINKKYNINYATHSKEINKIIEKNIKESDCKEKIRNNILPLSKLEYFIEDVANIDLEKYKRKIIENRKNILP